MSMSGTVERLQRLLRSTLHPIRKPHTHTHIRIQAYTGKFREQCILITAYISLATPARLTTNQRQSDHQCLCYLTCEYKNNKCAAAEHITIQEGICKWPLAQQRCGNNGDDNNKNTQTQAMSVTHCRRRCEITPISNRLSHF